MNVRRAVVLTYPRTGSNLLLSLLNSHSELYFHGELFHALAVGYRFPGASLRKLRNIAGDDLMSFRDCDHLKFLELIFTMSPTDVTAVGFKLFYDHSPDVLNRIFEDLRYTIILLERPNRLASFSSLLISGKTGQWTTTKPINPSDLHQIHFDASYFQAYVKEIDHFYQTWKEKLASRGNFIEITYAELSRKQNLFEIQTLLGCKKLEQLTTKLIKQNTRHPSGRFYNKAELIDFLMKIGHLDWLSEFYWE